MKTIKKLMVFLLAICTFTVLKVNAAISETIDNTCTGQTDKGKITITRNVKDVTGAVTNTFTYTITADPDSDNPAAVSGTPTTATIAFNNKNPETGTTTATQTATIDFSSITFTKLGDYKFKIAETASSNSTLYPVDDTYYYVYVSVRNDLVGGTGTDKNDLKPGEYTATISCQGYKNGATGTKGDIVFEKDSKTYLSISKKVSGNLGDEDEYFKFKITVTPATGASVDEYTISCTTPSTTNITYDGSTVNNPTKYDTTGDTYVYLKHGETCTVGKDSSNDSEIPASFKWTVVEEGASDYTTYINVETTSKTKAEANLNIDPTENVAAYDNYKDKATLTGLFLNILPFVLLVILGGLGIYAIKKTSREA